MATWSEVDNLPIRYEGCSLKSVSVLIICFRLLLMNSLGARVDLRNNEGKTPADLAHDAQTAALLQHAG